MSDIQGFLTTLSESIGKEVIKEILKIFEDQMTDGIPQLNDYLAKKDLLAGKQLAHKLKSSALNVGASQIGQIFLDIEKNTDSALNEGNLNKLKEHYQEYKLLSQKWIELNFPQS